MFEFVQIGPRRYGQFAELASLAGLRHGFSTRPEDMSARADAAAAERDARRRQMALDLGLDPLAIRYCVQTHEARIATVDGREPSPRLEGCDAVMTATADVPLVTFSADCPLLLVYSPRPAALALVHASWRCTTARLPSLVVAALRERWDVPPEQLYAGIGPSAGPQQYEVGQEVYAAAFGLPHRERHFPRRGGRMFFDLWSANRMLLEEAGVPPERIFVAGICTMTCTDRFYSFRKEGAGCGHFALMAALRREQRLPDRARRD